MNHTRYVGVMARRTYGITGCENHGASRVLKTYASTEAKHEQL